MMLYILSFPNARLPLTVYKFAILEYHLVDGSQEYLTIVKISYTPVYSLSMRTMLVELEIIGMKCNIL